MRHRLIASGALIAALMAATVTTTVGQTPRAVLSHRGAVYTLAFSPASTELASGVEDGTLLEWSVADETSVELISSPTDAVQSIAYSPSGNEIAVAESGGEFGFVSLPSAAFRGPYAATTDALAWTGFMSGGLTLMVVAHDGYMATLQVSDGALIRGFSHPTLLHAGAISPNGLIGASGGDDGIVRLWDLTTGAEVSPLPMDHGAVIWSLAFSPDGTMLASGGVDNVVRLWDPATGGTLGSYISHAGNIRSLAFSPDNATVASASDDGTVKLWDVASGIATTTLADHTGSVRAVAYSPDGSLLASGGEDSSVRIYDVGPAASITITAPAASEEFPAGTTSTPLTVTVSDHPAPGHWHWQLDTPFPATGTATGTPVTAGTLTDTITGLVGGTSYTVYVALVVDETHALVDSTTNPDSRANVAFSVADGGASTVTVTPQDRQGRESGTVTIPRRDRSDRSRRHCGCVGTHV